MKARMPCCFATKIRQDAMDLEMCVEKGSSPQGGQEAEILKESTETKIEPQG